MPRNLFSELKRRNVWRAAALYGAGAWLIVQVATQVFPFLDVPNTVVRGIIVAAVIGFPFWIALAWFYELTPEGLKRENELDPSGPPDRRAGKRLDRWIIAVLSVALVFVLTDVVVGPLRPRRALSALPAAPARSIAVLPFVNESSDRQQGYFADGISEDLLDLLAKLPALRVAARTSSFAFRGKDLPVDSIARALRVANVLEGSVQRAGEQVRITARLVHAADGYEVWSQTWDRRLGDVFAIQDEIARDVAGQLRVRLLGPAPQMRATDPRAYALFLEGREVGRQARPAALLRSDSLYRQVLTLDPRYAPAWREMSANSGTENALGMLSNAEAMRRERHAVGMALALDSASAPALALMGMVAEREGNRASAARELERALAVDPTNLDALDSSAGMLLSLGRLKEAIALQEYLVARDPVNAYRLVSLGFDYVRAGRYDDAIARLRTALTLSPDFGIAHHLLGLALLRKGDAPAALAEMRREPSESWRLVGLALVYHALGRSAASDSALAALIRKYPRDVAYNIAYVYAYRGEADRAFAWLEKAVAYRDPGLSGIVVEPLFDRIRSDPRWLPFLRRIGRAPEQLAKIRFHVRLPPSAPGSGASAATPAVTPPAGGP